MDNTFKRVGLLAVFGIAILCNHCAGGQTRCGHPTGILHGHSVVLRRGKLAQYLCNRNYFLYGKAMVSCVNGEWSGILPKCITFTCRPVIHPMHSDRQELLRGSLITYTCRDGFILEGVAEIYCDGERWSSNPPECRVNREARLLPPIPTEINIESTPVSSSIAPQDALVNSSVVSSSEIPVGLRDPVRPRYVSHSEQPSRFKIYEKLARNGVISLYKTVNADSEEDESTEEKLPPREQHIPPVEVNNPNPVLARPISPMIPQPSFPRYVPRPQNMPADRRFDWRYNPRAPPYFIRSPPYLPQYRPIPVPIYPNPLVTQSTFQRTQYVNRGTSNQRIVPGQEELPFVSSRSSEEIASQGDLWDTASNPSEGQQRIPSLEPTPPARIKVPPQTTEGQGTVTSDGNGACTVPLRPSRGYYQIRSLPRDYEGEALYLAEYHCQNGLTLIGGDHLRYCMKTGQWKGKLPRCEKNVKCDPGYIKQGDVCVDVNECAENNGGCAQTCLNFNGGHKCSCLPGYRKHQTNDCADIDECENDRCQHVCRNIPGSFECSCNPGYVVSKTNLNKCIDVNECATPGSRPCDHLCQNTIGSYRCACKPNFRLGEDGRSCFEVCMPGYAMKMGDILHKRGCVDEDECAEHNGLGNCEHICNNTAGSYFCSCNIGYRLNVDGQSCSDVNECEDGSPCSYECVNTIGSYRCSCLPNQVPAADGLRCLGCIKDYYMKDDKCIACPENSETKGIASTGITHCNCIPGYEGSPLLEIPCSDVDECRDENYGCSHHCLNTPGSVVCACPDGFMLDIDGRTCVDEDECLTRLGVCEGHECRNIPGGYTCVCMRGFRNSRVNPRKCVDIDECAIRNGGCQSRCHNMQPGHRCSCYSSKTLAKDGRTCIQTGNTCTPLPTVSNGRVLPASSCSDVPNVTIGQVCFYACNGGYKMRGIYRTRCGENGWSSVPPKCVGTGTTCQPLGIIPNGRALPASSCSRNVNVSMGRTCFFICKRGYTLRGVSRVTCGEGGWSSIPPSCVASDSCHTVKVPTGVRMSPATCYASNILPWKTCLFSCKNPEDILNGSRTTTCFPGGRWQHDPPTCIPNLSSSDRDSGVPWIRCPSNMSVNLPPGQSRAFIKGLRPITSMNTTDYIRSDGFKSLTSFPVGRTTIKFIADPGNGLQMASCETQIIVQDREVPVTISCPGTINIMSVNRYPGRVWKQPLFRDNVGIARVKETIFPPGKITWGKYRVSYIASDAGDNMAECTFTVIIKRATPRNQVKDMCGTPSGPNNGSPNCDAWAHGVYCNPTCKPGYAFAQAPSAYVCGEDGVWTPDSTIPDCMDVRTNQIRDYDSETTPATIAVTERGNILVLSSGYVTTTSTNEESTILNTSPVLRILKRPEFHQVSATESERSRFRPTLLQGQNVVEPEPPQHPSSSRPQNVADCPSGQVPSNNAADSKQCIDCPTGYYRPRIKLAMICLPCSPGFYQEMNGQSYCSRCPNVAIQYLSVLRRRVEFRGLTSREQCTLVDAYINKIVDSLPAVESIENRRNSFRSRYRQLRP